MTFNPLPTLPWMTFYGTQVGEGAVVGSAYMIKQGVNVANTVKDSVSLNGGIIPLVLGFILIALIGGKVLGGK